jgi:UPF0755 protein
MGVANDGGAARMKKFWVLLIGGVIAVMTFWPGAGQTFVEMDVKEGERARDVMVALQQLHLIGNAYPFRFWTRVRRAGPRIHTGKYRFSKGRSSFWIVDDLIQGRTEKVKVVIPEGFASWQIAERLMEAGVCDAQSFRNYVVKEKLEGYLFPATYQLAYGLSPAVIARTFKTAFDEHWTPQFEARAKQVGLTQHQVVTLASIIEREVRKRDELPLVSAVYNNRLKRNMRLEADPTVQYALGYWKTRLTYDDYRNTVSPYNTYLNNGLPPGPICSPGADAIRAALWPADSNALFLLAKDDGHHTFSSTYRDHAKKVNSRNKASRVRHK